jgi:hypothetical protein
MTRLEYTLVDVFTDRKFGGNQLAVFGDGGGIPDPLMQLIAKELNLPETVFVVRAEQDGDQRCGSSPRPASCPSRAIRPSARPTSSPADRT